MEERREVCTCVQAFVIDEVRRLCEALLARVAREWSFARVKTLVRNQVTTDGKRSRALVAQKRSLAWYARGGGAGVEGKKVGRTGKKGENVTRRRHDFLLASRGEHITSHRLEREIKTHLCECACASSGRSATSTTTGSQGVCTGALSAPCGFSCVV